MKLDKNKKILIVGLGLIGGSFADALTSSGYDVGAIDINPDSLTYALQNGLISSSQSEVTPDYIAQFDIIVFALYPHVFIDWIKQNQQYIKTGAVLTDVTGVKGSIVYEVQDMLRDDLEFIGAHPMAGKESSGVKNASKDIFNEANYIITPTDKNTAQAVELCRNIGDILGFKTVTTLSPEEHDDMIGFLSQLTHCIAVSLMVCRDATHLARYTGDSFRDLTRIAKINDEMWSELFMLNRDNLLSQMDTFIEKFNKLRNCVADGDVSVMRNMMKLSTTQREFFDQ